MKRKILSIALVLAVALQLCTVAPVFAADGFYDDFESSEIDTLVKDLDGWLESSDNAKVIADPFNKDGNPSNVIHVQTKSQTSGKMKRTFEPASGIIDVKMKYAPGPKDKASEYLYMYSDNTIIGGFWFPPTSGAAHNMDVVFFSSERGNYNENFKADASKDTILASNLSKATWYYITTRFNFDTQTMTAVISSSEITKDVMVDLEAAKAAGQIIDYKTDVPFANAVEYINAVEIGTVWGYQEHNQYCDYITVTPYKATPRYTVTFVDESGNVLSSQKIWENNCAEEPSKPEKAGYIFDGWLLNDTLYDFSTPVTSDIILTPKYTKRLVSIDENFNEYTVETPLSDTVGWSGSLSNCYVKASPVTGDEDNNVAFLNVNGSVTKELPASDGIVDISFRLSGHPNNLDAIWSSAFDLRCDDKIITSFAIARSDKTSDWNNYLCVLSDPSKLAEKTPYDSMLITQKLGTTNTATMSNKAPVWYYVKFRLDFNTAKSLVVISSSPISDDEISTPETSENILGYIYSDFADQTATYINSLRYRTAKWGGCTITIDDLYVADAPNQSYVYSVKDASYSIGDDGAFNVSASITKGETDSSVIVAAYDADKKLIYADVDHNTFGANTPNGSKIAYKTSFTTDRAADVDSIKVFVWNVETLTPMCTASPAAYVPAVTPDPTPAPTDDPNDISDVGAVEYEFADVQRAAVPVYVEEADFQAIPENLSDKVYRTYPDGKMKAFLLSFDDGPCINDFDVLLPLFKENNLVSAFNLNMGDNMKSFNKLIHYDPETGKSEYLQDATSEAFQEKVVKQYEGHEIGNHGTDHNPDYMLNKDNYRHEVGFNKYNIETIFNTECNSYIASYKGRTPDENPASGVWRTAYMKYLKLRYYRNAPLKNNPYAQRPAELNYKVPTSFYGWDPTIRITDNNIVTDVSDPENKVYYNSPEILQYYLDKDFGNEWTLFFGWGHGSDISSYDWNTHKLSVNGNYANFKTTCELAGSNSDVLWNVTPIDYVDYVNASRLTSVTQDGGSVIIHNPSKEIDVWLNVGGVNVAVPAGETLSIALD